MTGEQVAQGLTISAVAPDGVVEAIEAPGEPFLLAVQCHPEREGEATDFAAVIRGLVEATQTTLAGPNR
jgi:putative glutamine amidotransferase